MSDLIRAVAVILAGGLGTRIRHLHPDLPKPMIPAGGRPFLEWILRYLARQGLRRAVISSGYKAERIAAHFASGDVAGVQVQCVSEPEPLGTGGGFLHAVKAVAERPDFWVVLNGDSLIFADLSAAAHALASAPAGGGVLLGRPVPDTSRYGSLDIGPEGDLRRFVEKQPGRGVINAGIYLLSDALVRGFPDWTPCSLEKDVFPALTAGRSLLKVHVMDAPFLDIGTPESLTEAEAFIRNHLDQFVA